MGKLRLKQEVLHKRRLLPTIGITLLLWGALFGAFGCHRTPPPGSGGGPPAVPGSPTVTENQAFDSPGLPMPKRLEMIADAINPEEVLNENRRKADRLKAQLEGETDTQILFSLLPKYAEQLLKAGETEESLKQYARLETLGKKHSQGVLAGNLSEMRMAQGLAWLRLGEQENCLLNHTSDSCLLPIRGNGIHKAQRGSRNAFKVFTQVLQAEPNNLAARWLLNIAAMTLGEYPAKVPAKWQVPPEAFASDYDPGRFKDIAANLGLNLNRLSGGTIVEDFDNDGFLDIMTSCIGVREPLKLFHNNGDGTFTDISEKAGLAGENGGLNILQTDYNNDGFIDVLVLRGAWYGRMGHWPLSLLKNNGNGTFTNATEQTGLLRFHPTQTAFFFDYDGDGWLDLFIGNETKFDDVNPCELFHNNGNGTFTECAKEAGLDFVGFVKGCVTTDYNRDGRPDLYLSVQGHTNILFRNDGPADPSPKGKPTAWKFTDVTKEAGVEKPINTFSCFSFDYDNDGWPDLFVTGYSFTDVDVGLVAADYLNMNPKADYPALYHNNRNGTFTDVSKQARVHKLMWGMGINYGDLDNDGWLDFYVGTGNPELPFLTPNKMFHNASGQFFHDVTTSGGFGHLQKGHGISFGDINNDGQQDIYESMGGILDGDTAFNTLYKNPGHPNNHWLTLKLEGVQSNRAALGAVIRVVTQEAGKERSIYKTVSTGGSFGANPLRQEIGLGKATAITRVEIFWPTTGKTQTLTGLVPDCFYKVKEGETTATLWDLKPFPYAKADPHAQHHHH